MAKHQGVGERKEEEKEERREMDEVEEWQVQEAMRQSPVNSASGADDKPIKMVQTANQAHPGALRTIFTNILRKGKHPQIWKDADVVPIPKAKKPMYTTPKSWRAKHLLRVASKILERIVLRRLQDEEGEEGGELGKSQFGSRRNRGMTDAMTMLLRKRGRGKGPELGEVKPAKQMPNPKRGRGKSQELDEAEPPKPKPAPKRGQAKAPDHGKVEPAKPKPATKRGQGKPTEPGEAKSAKPKPAPNRGRAKDRKSVV